MVLWYMTMKILKYPEIYDFLEVVTAMGSMEDSKQGLLKGVLMRLLYDMQKLGFVYTKVKTTHFSSPS